MPSVESDEVRSAMLACCVVVVERARRPPARGPAVDWQRDPGNHDWNGILWECTARNGYHWSAVATDESHVPACTLLVPLWHSLT